MTPFETYLLVVSLIVLVSLVTFFSFLIWYVYVLTIRLTYVGYWDQELVQEYDFKRKQSVFSQRAGRIVSAVICSILSVMVIISIFLGITENKLTKSVSTLKVVQSDSMSKKHEDNKYLVENGLDNQFQMFDLITTHALPAEEDIKLYDVIVYERDGNLVIHRVVQILEPDENRPDRLFYTRGDANRKNDDLPVRYSQMRGIYQGKKIPFVGSFVLFMQSPAGIICLILAIFCMIIMPIVDNKIEDVRHQRYRRLKNGMATARIFYRRY